MRLKYFFCIDEDEDLQKIQLGELGKLLPPEDPIAETVTCIVGPSNQKEVIEEKLSEIDDEYIVFVPTKNVLAEPIDGGSVIKALHHCNSSGYEYCRLKRIGASRVRDKTLLYHKDDGVVFFQCPHLIKTSLLKRVIGNCKSGDLFWMGMHLYQAEGCFYFSQQEYEATSKDYTYFVPKIMHTMVDVLDHEGKWSDSYIDYNNKLLATKIAEYNINMEDRGVSNSISRCCS